MTEPLRPTFSDPRLNAMRMALLGAEERSAEMARCYFAVCRSPPLSPSTVALSADEEAQALAALSSAYSEWHAASRDPVGGGGGREPPEWLPQMRCLVQAGVPKVPNLIQAKAGAATCRTHRCALLCSLPTSKPAATTNVPASNLRRAAAN